MASTPSSAPWTASARMHVLSRVVPSTAKLDSTMVEEFYDPEIERRQNDVAKLKGFEIADHALSLYAHCTKVNCPNKQR